jgi:hypothetical protein
VGYGHSAGDPAAPAQTVEQVIKLLQTRPPWRRDLEPIYNSLEGMNKPVDWRVFSRDNPQRSQLP